jgi:hypothetical protein
VVVEKIEESVGMMVKKVVKLVDWDWLREE